MLRSPPTSPPFPYTTLFRSSAIRARLSDVARDVEGLEIRLTHDNGIRRGRIARVELRAATATVGDLTRRSEEHTSELQSHSDLVCRLLLEKKKKKKWVDNRV